MGVVGDFVSEYERQFDFWEASAHIARTLLETELTSSGVRAIVTSRAKSPDRLFDKLHLRDRVSSYNSFDEIRQDIVDLAGVRVALYFPGQMDEVERVIRETFNVQKVKKFPPVSGLANAKTGPSNLDANSPEPAAPRAAAHRQRFSGYGAQHFRAYIPRSHLSMDQVRYASALVEVQVASVLMHAWSEVEHDLVYKPLEGELSTSEYALLDQLNGLVLSGEIALEQLQKAGDARVTGAETPFRDHYELAEFLRTRLSARDIDLTDSTLGRVDILFDYLVEQSSATSSSVETYLDLLRRDFEHRPVAAQLADLMLSGNEARYTAFLRAISASHRPSIRRGTTVDSLKADSQEKLALGEFVTAWVLLETVLNDRFKREDGRLPSLSAQMRHISELGLISSDQYSDLESIRALRNQVFHGRAGSVPPERLKGAAAWLRHLVELLGRDADQNTRG